jgi:hypothetical protein
MSRSVVAALVAFAIAIAPGTDANAATRTVCTITVNSDDERNAFRQHLPRGDYQFVELVERGRSDWLASACRKGVRCDILVISGHFNGSDFFSDQLDASEFLPVAEMERVSCSDSCPGLFSQLKEVYMFGCETLNGDTIRSASSDALRSLVHSGRAPTEPELRLHRMAERHGESNREVMRRVFPGVPAIYGFSSVAPLGSTAGPLLSRYFKAAGNAAIGSGRPNRSLVNHFARHSLTMTSGLKPTEPRAAHRADVCRFVDDRLAAAQKLAFVHEVLRRDMSEVRSHFERIERLLAMAPVSEHDQLAWSQAMERISQDRPTRDRFLAYARDADHAAIRFRMIDVAHAFGWLTTEQRASERNEALLDLMARPALTAREADLVCALAANSEFEVSRVESASPRTDSTGHAAALACLGSEPHHARMLQAMTSSDDRDIEMAEVYFQHRPISDGELRALTSSIAAMTRPEAQVRALHALSRQRVADGDGLTALARLFPVAGTVAAQRAIASVFIRGDYRSVASPELVRVFRDYRKRSEGEDIIDVLIRRMEGALAMANAQVRR